MTDRTRIAPTRIWTVTTVLLALAAAAAAVPSAAAEQPCPFDRYGGDQPDVPGLDGCRPGSPGAGTTPRVVVDYSCDWSYSHEHYHCSGTFVESDDGKCDVYWTDADADSDYEDPNAEIRSKSCLGGT